MSNRTLYSGLWLLTGLGVLAAIIVAVAGYLLPVAVFGKLPAESTLKHPAKPVENTSDSPQVFSLPSLSSYAPIWNLQLRPKAKIVTPPPAPVQHVAPPPPSKPFTAKLTGTILEADRSMALFTTKTGDIQFVSIGQMIEDAKVVQIEPEKVILDRNGQTLTIELTESTEPTSSPTPSRRNVYNRRRPVR